MDRHREPPHTSQQILDVAQRLVQTRGFNAFSYADIADVLKITKASLHYHFPTKAALGVRLIERYEDTVCQSLAEIDRMAPDAAAGLRGYADIYARVLSDGRLCLCGMLAAEYGSLPPAMQEALGHYFAANEHWLAGVMESGRTAGALCFDETPGEAARYLIGALIGSMVMALTSGGVGRFVHASQRLFAGFGLRPEGPR